MIKSKAVLRKSFRQLFSEGSDLLLLKDHYESFKPHKWQCPHCHQTGQFSKASSYCRTLITVEQGVRTEYRISVPRLCCDCGHCHAIIPDFLVPYGSYSIRFILYVLKEYKERSCSVSAFCDHWQIAVSTLYDWIHRFTDHFNLWVGVIRSICRIETSAIDRILDTIEFPSVFLQVTPSFSFLQHYVPRSYRHADT